MGIAFQTEIYIAVLSLLTLLLSVKREFLLALFVFLYSIFETKFCKIY
jgi:hypothetical protein